ncbi:MAG: Ig-like domain-containing protein, partial [Gammaproteobacteria bacterium]|nr:Ig-like domain-containing protein [Gammaproteobacteria bacterium]
TTGGNLAVSPAATAVGIGSTTRLVATGGGFQLNWTSSDTSVATIDNRGILKAHSAGVTNISVTDELNNTGTTTVEVREISIDASVLTIGAGDTLQLAANGGQAPYQWTVSNSTLASIDSNGLLSTTLGATGGILVTATDKDGVEKGVIVTINNSTALRSPQSF